jgi:hypothetical protein
MYTKAGYPDLLIKLVEFHYTLNVECKDSQSIESAIKALRPSQRGMMKELFLAGAKVLLLYNTGCAVLLDENLSFTAFHNTEGEFLGFKKCLEYIREKQK